MGYSGLQFSLPANDFHLIDLRIAHSTVIATVEGVNEMEGFDGI